MPSPFPGMDPYLENPATWPDFHHALIGAIKESLNAHITPRYYALVEHRVYISREDDPGRQLFVADVAVHLHADAQRRDTPTKPTATLPVEVITMLDEEIQEPYLAIYDQQRRRVVTVVEVLSPANKMTGSDGFASYRAKRNEIQRSAANLVEIDLLRAGRKLLEIPLVQRSDYCIHVSKAASRPRGSVWPVMLENRLPEIDIPLLDDDAPVPFDLQKAIDDVYRRAQYEVIIDYKRACVPPLPDRLAEWADNLLRQKGLRD